MANTTKGGAGTAATLRSMGGTAMHWAIRSLAVFIMDIQIVLLCCAAFRIGEHDSEKRFPACAKPRQGVSVRVEASAGEARSEKIMLK
jgi:hypothetical protein